MVRWGEVPACSIRTPAGDSAARLGVPTVVYVPGHGQTPCDADKSPRKPREVWDFSLTREDMTKGASQTTACFPHALL